MSRKRYYSKISIGLALWITVPLTTIFILLSYEGIWLVAFLILLLLLFILHMLKTTYYEIEDSSLLIKSGFLFQQIIDITQIEEIKESNNPLSSPAASMDRLEIKGTGFSSVLISPKEKTEFIAHVQKIKPGVIFKPKLKRTIQG